MPPSAAGPWSLAADDVSDAGGGVRVRWLFAGPHVAISRWHCFSHERSWSEEKAQRHCVFVFLHHGAFGVRDAAGHQTAEPSAVLAYPAGMPYCTSHPFGCGEHGSAIAVSPEALHEIAPELAARRSASVAAIDSRVLLAHRRFVAPVVERQADALAAEETAWKVIGRVATALTGRAPDRPRRVERRGRRERVELIKKLLLERLHEPVRLADLAAEAGVSVFHLCRSFREETGLPIHRYLNRLRLCVAVEEATRVDSDLLAVALSVGFSSHSHFTAAFRKEFGTTPSALRDERSENG
jgi:AraC-like DNA-binding protein